MYSKGMDKFLKMNHEAINKTDTILTLYGPHATIEDFGLTNDLLDHMETIFDEMAETDEVNISNDTRELFIRCLVYIQYKYRSHEPIVDIITSVSQKTGVRLPSNLNNLYDYFTQISTLNLVIFGW
jgi:hypothetical protein